jgi:D-alanyl-lipoteichoic acid acyltransferase DltB (MBOAT superfamily)
MLFPTASFAVFFLAVFVGGWLLFSGRSSWRLFMLAASYLFCGLFDWDFLWLFAAITLVGWLCIVAIETLGPRSRGASAVVTLGVVLHVGVLVYFKQLGFFVNSATSLMKTLGVETGWTAVQVAIPVGISYLTFRGISAMVDVYRGDAPAPSLIDHALFMVFFPYVAAGPVVRLREVVPQWLKQRSPSRILATQGFLLIAGGLVKKMLIADYLARVAVDEVFAMPTLFGSVDVLAGVYAYAAQIYCDFSGYTDMAIGIALLLGISLPQNFDAPYAALSIQSFWRKWHITLSSFIRDYIYIPLGGSRKGEARTYVNQVAAMVVAGLWHGAGLTFAIWGLLHGVGLATERWLRVRFGSKDRPLLPGPVAWFVTLQFVCLGWIFFPADSVGTAFAVIGRIFTAWDTPARLPVAVWVFVLGVVAVQFIPKAARALGREAFWRIRPAWQGLALAVILFVVSALGPEGPTAFIYAGF